MQKVNIIKKGFAALQIGPCIRKALEQFCGNEHYDLILMATPPITLAGVVEQIKKRDHARVYIMLKDIWPQGIVDLGVLSRSGFKGLIYHYFRAKEQKLYALADRIGCMSPANVAYIRGHNPRLPAQKVELCCNAIEYTEIKLTPERRTELREKYGIPLDKPVFLYGGNLGRPQDVPFLIECLKACEEKDDRFFVICGTGTEYPKLRTYADTQRPRNVLLLNGLPKVEYDDFAAACDIGMIFLDHRFTIPNFPSRLLSYLQAGMPVLCCTDPNTDIGDIAEAGGFGWKCSSAEVASFVRVADLALTADRTAMGLAAKAYLKANYTVEDNYKQIMRCMEEEPTNV